MTVAVRSKLHTLAVVVIAFALPQAPAQAKRTKQKDCRPAGPPTELQTAAAFEHLNAVSFLSGRRVLKLDRANKPKRIESFSSDGDAERLAKSPPAHITGWAGHPQAAYAVGVGRSLADGGHNVVMVRWGAQTRRPKMTALWPLKGSGAEPIASISNDHMVVGWAQQVDGQAQWHVGVVDLGEARAAPPIPLGKPAAGVSGHVFAWDDGFGSVWNAAGTTRMARFDSQGQLKGEPLTLSGIRAGGVVGAIRCENNFYLVHAGKGEKAQVLLADDQGGTTELWSIRSVINPDEVQLTCTGGSAVIGRRSYHEKSGTVTFFVSTVGPDGRHRDRRVKEMKGKPGDVSSPLITGDGRQLTAFWVEREGGIRANLRARELVCR